jgi:hypothetical protein
MELNYSLTTLESWLCLPTWAEKVPRVEAVEGISKSNVESL